MSDDMTIEVVQDEVGAWTVGGKTFDRLLDAKEWAHLRPPELGLHPDRAYCLVYRACTEKGWREVQAVSRL